MKATDPNSLSNPQEALDLMRGSSEQTRSAIDREAGNYFLIWGHVYVIVPMIVLFLPELAGWLANLVVVAGIALTVWLGSRSPVRSPLGFRLWMFWLVAFFFSGIFLTILGGENFPRFDLQVEGRQTWGFGIAMAMMIYVLMGLVMRSPIFIFLGFLVASLALLAFFFAWEHSRFWIWMAVATGGPLLVAGGLCKFRPSKKQPSFA